MDAQERIHRSVHVCMEGFLPPVCCVERKRTAAVECTGNPQKQTVLMILGNKRAHIHSIDMPAVRVRSRHAYVRTDSNPGEPTDKQEECCTAATDSTSPIRLFSRFLHATQQPAVFSNNKCTTVTPWPPGPCSTWRPRRKRGDGSARGPAPKRRAAGPPCRRPRPLGPTPR